MRTSPKSALSGRAAFPIFLANGQPPRHTGLGFNDIKLQPSLMKLRTINGVFCIAEGDRIVFEFSNGEDAELVLKVLQHFQFDHYSPVGDATKGGIRLLGKSSR